MTNEEAIEQLKINIGKEPLSISGSATRMAEYFKALAIASEALEKQIRKKPKDIETFENPYGIPDKKYGFCPICDMDVNEALDWCPYCGNRLDWSESDEQETVQEESKENCK